MLEFNDYVISIKVDLPIGLWAFTSASATGKTWLCKCLNDLEVMGKPVCGYSYNDYLCGRDLHAILTNPKYKLIMLDRYDMYAGIEVEAIREKAKSAIVLLDCKRGAKGIAADDICFVDIFDDRIEVSK